MAWVARWSFGIVIFVLWGLNFLLIQANINEGSGGYNSIGQNSRDSTFGFPGDSSGSGAGGASLPQSRNTNLSSFRSSYGNRVGGSSDPSMPLRSDTRNNLNLDSSSGNTGHRHRHHHGSGLQAAPVGG